MFEGYIDKDNIEFINKWSIVKDDIEYHVFFEGRIYNLMSLMVNSSTLKKRDIRHTIFEVFESYNFDFKRLNNDLNGDYALVVVKEVCNRVEEVWMSTDHIGHIKLYFITGGDDGTLIRFSTVDINEYIMPAGHMSYLILNKEGVIKNEVNKEYDMCEKGKIYMEIDNVIIIARFALMCIIENRIDYIKNMGHFTRVIINNDTIYDKLLLLMTPEIVSVEKRDTPFDSPSFFIPNGVYIYPFLDKTYMRLLKRICISEKELAMKLLEQK